MKIRSYPKINLALDILKKTDSGYHEIRTVIHEFKGLADEVQVEVTESGLEVFCDNPNVPTDEKNTALKAAVLLRKTFSISRGAKISITKNIPLMSGLGGGSSNAVATLKALVELWNVHCCSDTESHVDETCALRRIADQIGMDCAFFWAGGTALAEHFGEKITPLPPLPKDLKIEIIPTSIEISSRWAYENVDLKRCGKNLHKTELLIGALKKSDTQGVLENSHNDFETLIFSTHPALLQKKREIESSRGGRVTLCGSGGALVHIILPKLPF